MDFVNSLCVLKGTVEVEPEGTPKGGVQERTDLNHNEEPTRVWTRVWKRLEGGDSKLTSVKGREKVGLDWVATNYRGGVRGAVVRPGGRDRYDLGCVGEILGRGTGSRS